MAPRSDLVFVIGSPNSSNSVRLVEVAKRAGAKQAYLVGTSGDVDWSWLDDVDSLGISAGASAPEELVEQLLEEIAKRFTLNIEEVRVAEEDVVFKLPKEVA